MKRIFCWFGLHEKRLCFSTELYWRCHYCFKKESIK